MKILATAFVLLLGVNEIRSQDLSPNMYELGVGFDVLMGPSTLTDFWNSGGSTSFTYHRYVSDQVALTFGIAGNRFGIKRDKVEEYVTGELPDSLAFLVDLLEVDDGDVFVASGMIGLSYDMPVRGSSFENTNEGKIFFYPRVAVGVAYNAINDLELGLLGQTQSIDGTSKVGFLVEGGAGFRFFLTNNLGLSVEGTFVANFSDAETLTYLPIRLGVVYR